MSVTEERYEVRAGCTEIHDPDIFLAAIRAIGLERGCRIVCLDAEKLAGTRHVITAVTLAMRAWDKRSCIADSIEMEILCYAAGSRQCNTARAFGIHPGMNRMYIVFIPPSERAVRDLEKAVVYSHDYWDDISEDKMYKLMELFHVTYPEMTTVGRDKFRDLILERVALLDVYK